MPLLRIVSAANIAVLVCTIAASPLLGQQTAAQSLKGLTAAEGLEVSLWAAEPQLVNPTNIDIDERGRVWVLEAVNYRRKGQKDFRPLGDRITILEDTDGNGRADKMKVFDQNPALRSPLGIAVLGNKVIVSQSPDIIVYTKDEHDKIIDKQVLLTGWNGIDRDHGLHAVTFGPDGRLYFTVGDAGFDVTDRSGKRVGSSRRGPYYAGTTLRMNPDGSGLTVMGHNFRNPYESAVDSFGTIWQTDNDDDGYAWVRVNYVMEGGNFGYWGPGGRSWREDKGSHFHAERPGVVPNLARTGAGSPSGLVVYEGTLLPEKYRGNLIHAETGKRLINTYFLSRDGAGYSLKTEDTVKGGDTWFRPTDVAVSPDGAVFVSDWYDAVVGGNQMHDIRRGRIYRIAPAGYKAKRIKLDFETPEGLTAAFRSPAHSVRYLARTKLKEQGEQALPTLRNMWRQGDRVLQARALWLLAGAGADGRREVEAALAHEDPDFRTLAIRVLREQDADIVAATRPLLRDPSPQVRREVALALQYVQPEVALDSLTELSRRYDGKDRWYLEALGIAARGKEDLLYTRLREVFPEKWNPLLGRLLWEFRPPATLPYLIERLSDAELDASQRAHLLEVLSAMPSAQAGEAVARFIGDDRSAPQLVATTFDQLRRQLFSEWIELRSSPLIMKAIRRALNSPGLEGRALELIDDLGDGAYGPDLLALAESSSVPDEIRGAAIQALGKAGNTYAPDLERLSGAGPLSLRVTALRALGFAAPKGLEQKLKAVIGSPAPNEFRAEAVRVLGRSERGLNLLLDLQASGALPPELKSVASAVTNASRNPLVKQRAEKLLPLFPTRNRIPLRPLHKLAGEEGDVEKGKKIFDSATGPKCASCHSLGGKRKVGPDLSGIGGKLGKVGLIDSILNPSAGIAPEFTVWVLETKTQGQVIGILHEDTPQRVVVGADTGEELRLKPSDIASRRQSRLSMMPEDLINTMTEQQLIDVVQYLTTLRDPGPAAVSNRK